MVPPRQSFRYATRYAVSLCWFPDITRNLLLPTDDPTPPRNTAIPSRAPIPLSRPGGLGLGACATGLLVGQGGAGSQPGTGSAPPGERGQPIKPCLCELEQTRFVRSTTQLLHCSKIRVRVRRDRIGSLGARHCRESRRDVGLAYVNLTEHGTGGDEKPAVGCNRT